MGEISNGSVHTVDEDMTLSPSEEPLIVMGMETASTRPDIRHDLPGQDPQAVRTHGMHFNTDLVADGSDTGSASSPTPVTPKLGGVPTITCQTNGTNTQQPHNLCRSSNPPLPVSTPLGRLCDTHTDLLDHLWIYYSYTNRDGTTIQVQGRASWRADIAIRRTSTIIIFIIIISPLLYRISSYPYRT